MLVCHYAFLANVIMIFIFWWWSLHFWWNVWSLKCNLLLAFYCVLGYIPKRIYEGDKKSFSVAQEMDVMLKTEGFYE